jgi:hypothetical protein
VESVSLSQDVNGTTVAARINVASATRECFIGATFAVGKDQNFWPDKIATIQ